MLRREGTPLPQPCSPIAGWESRISAGRRAIPGSKGLQGRREGASPGSKYNVPGGAGWGGNCAGQEAASSCPSLGHAKDQGRSGAAGRGGSIRRGRGLNPHSSPSPRHGELRLQHLPGARAPAGTEGTGVCVSPRLPCPVPCPACGPGPGEGTVCPSGSPASCHPRSVPGR